jgi:hypothetical protein
MVAKNLKIGIMLPECWELPPHVRAIQKAVGMPVWGFPTMVNWIFELAEMTRSTSNRIYGGTMKHRRLHLLQVAFLLIVINVYRSKQCTVLFENTNRRGSPICDFLNKSPDRHKN